MSDDPRFGLAGLTSGGWDLLEGAHCGRGYYYNQVRAEDPRFCPQVRGHPWADRCTDLTTLPQLARDYPGRWWLIGNEPNNAAPEAGDVQTPEAYAEYLWQVAQILRANDPTCKLVGPHVLNWERAGGFGVCGPAPGRAWAQAMVDAYHRWYGALPLDGWAIHTYGLTAQPTEDWAGDIADVMACRSWLNAVGLGGLPIWITEYGAVNACNVQGAYDHGALCEYVGTFVPWLMSRGYWDYGVTTWEWFVATADGSASSFAYAQGLELGPAGQRLHDYAGLVSGPRPPLQVSVGAHGPASVRVTVATSGGPHNTIDQVVFPAGDNALVDGMNPGGPVISQQVAPLTVDYGHLGSSYPRHQQIDFLLYKRDASRPMTQPFTVRDCAGPWQTFAGMG